MGLRTQAAADLATILEDDTSGFGWSITVTDPNGTSAALKGFSTDIAASIDPDTGTLVLGRSASVALRLAALTAAGLGLPKGVPDETSKPWVVVFDDINGTSHTFKVREGHPDYALGIVVCHLDEYEPLS